MNSGEKLKELLGLQGLEKVFYCRVIGLSAYTVYLVVYDTRRPQANLTTYETVARQFAATSVFNRDGKMKLTLLRRIEEFRGSFSTSLFIRVDISGRFGDLKKFSEKILVEDLSLSDFQNASVMSSLTAKYLADRRKALGSSTVTSKFIDVLPNIKRDFIEIQFLSEVTSTDPGETDPAQNFEIKSNPSRTYEVKIRCDGFFTWLLKTLPKGQPLTKADVYDAMNASSIKIWSNSPSFHWQGFNYRLSQLNAAMLPTGIPSPHWDKYHGDDALLDKHTSEIFKQWKFWEGPITNTLNTKLKGIL